MALFLLHGGEADIILLRRMTTKISVTKGNEMIKVVIAVILAFIMFIPAISCALSVGDEAPDFEATTTQGTVKLSEFEGKKNVVLALYFTDFTPL
jgi:hypothetical protein